MKAVGTGCNHMRAYVRAYEELNDFLAPERKKKEFAFSFESKTTVRRVLQCLRIPVSAVDLVLADGESVSLFHILRENERLSLFPVFELLDIGPIQRVRSRPLRQTRFAIGPDLIGLASYLRLFGFNIVPANGDAWNASKDRLSRGSRILLTRHDAKKSKPGITHVLHITKPEPFHQFFEVVDHLDLWSALCIDPATQIAESKTPGTMVFFC